MKYYFTILIIINSLFLTKIFAQTYSMRWSLGVEAEVSEQPVSTKLKWLQDTDVLSYIIYRKQLGENSWGGSIATLPAGSTEYLDVNIQQGVVYEYKIQADRPTYPDGYGYIATGIGLSEVESRGSLALVIDDTYAGVLDAEITQLKLDLIGDGWQVFPLMVNRSESVISVKAKIQALYNSLPDLTTVYLLGHVPVPYSGNIAPDGHSNHRGAWPADGYYGDMDGIWTDTLVTTNVGPTRIRNVPGDAKFDQNIFPSEIELTVGRVDFYNMPAFSENDTVLLQNYLSKSHAFKYKEFVPEMRGVVDDHFTSFSEGFAANGLRNFPGLVGLENVTRADYFNSLNNGSYIWSYGCGSGTYTSAGGIGNTGNFASNAPQGIFTILFGSYFGDWDTQNNFLRAPLASGDFLTNCWAGRPHWYFHHMGMGFPIGYSTIISQNNDYNTYNPTGSYSRYIHMGLMGDPSLRMHIVEPPADFQAEVMCSDFLLSWTSPQDSLILGYYLYRADSLTGEYTRLNNTLITDTSYMVTGLGEGTHHFMLRALKLETTRSGSYYNLSTGVFVETEIQPKDIIPLHPGWNLISFDVMLDNRSLSEVFSSLAPGNLQYVTGFDEGSILYDPSLPSFLNSLTSIEDSYGYWVKVQMADTLAVCGTSIPADYKRNLSQGWSLIGYPPLNSTTPEIYFDDLISNNNLIYAIGFNQGALLFDSDNPIFLNSLDSLHNGFGYWIKTNSAVSTGSWLQSNPSDVTLSKSESQNMASASCSAPNQYIGGTPSSGRFYGQVTINQQIATANDIMLAYDAAGNLAGSANLILNNGIAYISLLIYGDDNFTTTIDEGMGSSDNYFTLRLYDVSEGSYLDILDDNGNPFQFTEWVNNNGGPIPAYSDIATVYDFTALYCTVERNCSPPDSSTPTNSVGAFYGQVIINNIPAEMGDQIIAYDSDKNIAGRSTVIINGGIAYISLPIYGDDISTTTDEGMGSDDNYFILQLYDESAGSYLDILGGDGNSIQFTEWGNYNGAPIPVYSDYNIVYNFEIRPNIWIGPATGYWNENPAYWSKGHIPTACDHVSIPAGASVIVQNGFTGIAYTLEVAPGGALTVNENADFRIVVGEE